MEQTATQYNTKVVKYFVLASLVWAIVGMIIGVILLNVLEMTCDYYGIEKHPLHYMLYVGANLFFSWIYYFEAVLKLVGLGPRHYFGDKWCRFDFVLVCLSLLDQYASSLLQLLPLPPTTLRVFRIFRILRVLRLLKSKRAKGIRDLLMTMVRRLVARIIAGNRVNHVDCTAAWNLPLPIRILSLPHHMTNQSRARPPLLSRHAGGLAPRGIQRRRIALNNRLHVRHPRHAALHVREASGASASHLDSWACW